MIPDYFPPSPEGVAYACKFVGAQPYVFDRRGRFGGLSRSKPCVRERNRAWAFMRSAWGWSYKEISRQTGCNWSTVLSSFRNLGTSNEWLAEYRRDLLAGKCEPVYTDLPTPPVLEPVKRKPSPRRPRVNSSSCVRKPRTAERLAAAGIKMDVRKHAAECECATCAALNDLARRMAVRPNLEAKDVDVSIRERFIRARSAMGKESAA